MPNAWRHVHRLIDQSGADATWGVVAARVLVGDAVPVRDLYPGDDQVDILAASGYGRPDLASTVPDTFADWHREVRCSTDNPAIIFETGAGVSVRGDYLDRLGDFFESYPDAQEFVWSTPSERPRRHPPDQRHA